MGRWNIVYNKENAKQNNYAAEIIPIMEQGFVGSIDASVRDLTVKTDNGYKGLLLLPQTLNPWITKTGGTDENPEYKITGTARVLVKCKLVDTVSNVQLWPNTNSHEETAWVGVSLVGEPKDINGKPNKSGSKANAMFILLSLVRVAALTLIQILKIQIQNLYWFLLHSP